MSQDNTPKHVFTGVFIPVKIWLHPGFTPVEKMMLAEIKALGEENGWCYAGNAHFAKWLKCSPQNVSNYISSFKKQGFIDVKFSDEKTHSGRKMRVNLKWYQSVQNPLSDSVPPLSGAVTPYTVAVTERHFKYTSKEQQQLVAAENENPSHVEERNEEKAPSISGGSPIGAPSASQPFRTYEPFDLYEQVEAIRTDYKMRENLTIVAKVPQPFFEPYLEAFKAKEEAIGCNHTSTREFRAHFINFCRARYRSERAQPAPSAQPSGSLPKNLRRV